MFSDDGFRVDRAQDALDLSVATFTNLWVAEYQRVMNQFLQRNALARQQRMTRGNSDHQRITPNRLSDDVFADIRCLGEASVIHAVAQAF